MPLLFHQWVEQTLTRIGHPRKVSRFDEPRDDVMVIVDNILDRLEALEQQNDRPE
jgi:hypothetical protein